MENHDWYRYYYNAWGLWGCMPSAVQTFKCKKCAKVENRPDDGSHPKKGGCQGGNRGKA